MKAQVIGSRNIECANRLKTSPVAGKKFSLFGFEITRIPNILLDIPQTVVIVNKIEKKI